MFKFLKLIKNEEGATAIEYGLIAAGISVAIIAVVQGLGSKLKTTFTSVQNALVGGFLDRHVKEAPSGFPNSRPRHAF